jgi:hypothetical protein
MRDPVRLAAAAPRRREARINLWGTFVVSLFFAALLSAPLYIGAEVLMSGFRDQPKPVNPTAAHQTAHFSSSMLDGTSCRNIVFDNNTAQLIEDKVGPCDHRPSKANSAPRFSWGK